MIKANIISMGNSKTQELDMFLDILQHRDYSKELGEETM